MKKGFTLIEMIGSIIILAMIALVAFPAVLNLITNSQKKVDKSMQDAAISAASEYVMDHVNCYPRISTVPSECTGKPQLNDETLTVETLINAGYLSEKDINNQTELKNDVIKITNSSEKDSKGQALRYIYSYIIKY